MPRRQQVVLTVALLAEHGGVAASSTAHELPLASLPGPSPPPPLPLPSLPGHWQPLNLLAEQNLASSAHPQLSALPPPPSLPPPSPPPTESSTEPSLHPGAAFVRVVRPFATHDFSKLLYSFDRWDEVVPCASGAAAAGPLPRPELCFTIRGASVSSGTRRFGRLSRPYSVTHRPGRGGPASAQPRCCVET